MRLDIFSLQGSVYHGEVNSVNLRTKAGEITILDHHRPLISILETGTIKITDSVGESREIEVLGGFLEIAQGNKMSILADF